MDDVLIETPFGHVYGKGAGPKNGVLVLGIHGWSQRNGWHTWEPLVEPLGVAGYHTVSVDMPGWGQSSSAQTGPLEAEAAVGTVLALLEGLGAKAAVLMGKSWGGGIALRTALEHRDRVQALILTAPAFRQLDRLPEVIQPVLLAWAEDDPVIPYRYAQTFVDALPRAELVTYSGGGHSAAPKNAHDFLPRAIQFLEANTCKHS